MYLQEYVGPISYRRENTWTQAVGVAGSLHSFLDETKKEKNYYVRRNLGQWPQWFNKMVCTYANTEMHLCVDCELYGMNSAVSFEDKEAVRILEQVKTIHVRVLL